MAESRQDNEKIGRFRILERMGTSRDVYLAEDEDGTQVVLEVLVAPARNQGLLDPRIADEASAYARLSHPNIVKVVDLFSTEGHFAIAFEHTPGVTLAVLWVALKRAAATLDDKTAAYIGTSLFAALAAAHDARDDAGLPAPLMHRNVNPTNVHIGLDGVVRLAHFNVASAAPALRDSNPSFTWGSYGYSAPETLSHGPVGLSADVYGASLVVWELLTGRKAIDRAGRSDADILASMARPEIPPLDEVRPDAPASIRAAVTMGLKVDPAERLVTAVRLRDVLAGSIDAEVERGRLAELVARVQPKVPPRRTVSRPDVPRAVAPPKPAVVAPVAARSLTPAPRPVVKAPPATPAVAGPAPEPESLRPSIDVVSVPPSAELASIRPSVDVTSLLPSEPPPVAPASPEPVSPPPVLIPVPLVDANVTPAPVEPALPYPFLLASRPPPPPAPRSSAPLFGVGAGVLVVAVGLAFALSIGVEHPAPSPTVAAPATPKPAPTQAATATESAPPPALATATVSATALATASATVSATVSATASATASEPAPATASASASEPAPSVPPDRGELRFPPSAAGHRIFVDKQVVGDGSQPALVRCGPHDIKIGSAGATQHVVVPCGGSLDLGAR